MKSLVFFLALYVVGYSFAWAAPVPQAVLVAPNIEVPVTRYGTGGRTLIVWLPSENGLGQAQQNAAEKLAQRGYSVWLADLFGARFLPIAPSSFDAIPPGDVAGLIHAAAKTHRKIILVSSGRGAAATLSGAKQWQAQHRSHNIAGAVLLFPNLLTASPEAGEDATYLPITRQTRLPIAILQGDKSPWHWQLDTLKQQLTKGGSRVVIKNLPGMRDRFYFREDASPQEQELGDQLDSLIDNAIKSLPGLKPRIETKGKRKTQ